MNLLKIVGGLIVVILPFYAAVQVVDGVGLMDMPGSMIAVMLVAAVFVIGVKQFWDDFDSDDDESDDKF